MKFTALHSGLKMPLIGLGSDKLLGHDVVYNALDAAFKSGYRLIDTAACYRNEKDIGDCLLELLPKHGLSREDIFLESKLDPKDHGLEEAYTACLESLAKLQTDYLDLYLIHWPAKAKIKSDDPRHAGYRKESWMALEKLYKEGKVKHIGVSNYTLKHLEEMASYASIQPAVLQVEYHPLLVQRDLLQWCKANNVLLQTYRSLGKGKLLSEPVVVAIAERIGKMPAQVLLQWAIQQDLGVIPRSGSPTHIEQNIASLDLEPLAEADLDALTNLHRGERLCRDPTDIV
ncbi:glyoxal reductase-like isoform X2 [Patiria miniata]|uniref:NADP-dependent oxidoreductase domain-containing protein n=1 Tax=Patiria miniata TaxID=46514 RepID=A0A913Z037_PATMI|nr:glyoxal reductase-like isoform X2 [Patiria miniata]